MVRIKHRYLLVNILYPDTPLPPSAQPFKPADPSHPSEDVRRLPDVVRFHAPTPSDITLQILLRSIREQIGLLFGDYGAGVTAGGLSIKYFSPATSTFILRCPRAHSQLVWSAVTYLTHLPQSGRGVRVHPCVMKVVRVSGTIRKAEEEAVRRARADILRARRAGAGMVGGLERMLGAGEGMVGGEGEEGVEGMEGIVDEDEDEDEDDDDDGGGDKDE